MKLLVQPPGCPGTIQDDVLKDALYHDNTPMPVAGCSREVRLDSYNLHHAYLDRKRAVLGDAITEPGGEQWYKSPLR